MSLFLRHVVGPLPPVEEFTEPVYNQVNQEQIVAGVMILNIVEKTVVQEQAIVQNNSDLQVMERTQEQIVDTTKEVPQERVQQGTVEQIVRVPVPQIQEQVIAQEIPQVVERIQEQSVEPIEVPLHEHVQALSVLENVHHERQRQFDQCVQVLKREKEKLRVREERGPPQEQESLHSHIQSGKDAQPTHHVICTSANNRPNADAYANPYSRMA